MRGNRIWLSLFSLVFSLNASWGKNTLISNYHPGSWYPGEIEYLLTSDTEIEQISLKNTSWQQAQADQLNFSATNEVLWIRLRLNEQDSANNYTLLIDYPIIDSLSVWFYQNEELVKDYHTGSHLNFYSRPTPHPLFRFLVLKGNQEILIRARASLNLQVPLKLFPNQDLYQFENIRDFWQASYFGLSVLAVFTSLLLGFITGNRVFFAYLGHLIGTAFITLHLGGYCFAYFWPEYPIINQYEPLIFGLGVFSTLFSMEFLDTRNNAPGFNKALWVSIILNLLVFPLALLGYIEVANQLVQMVGFFGCFLMLIAGIHLYRKGFTAARFFILAWSIFLVGVMITILQRVSVLPLNELTLHASQIGSALEVFLLTAAVADRLLELKKERDRASEKLLSEIESKAQIIAQQNEVLETEVQKKTKKLAAQNKRLNQVNQQQNKMIALIGHDLRGPLASIGQSLELMKEDPGLRNEEFLGLLQSSTFQSYALLENILQWARMEGGQIMVSKQELALYSMVKDLINLFGPSVKQKNLGFTYKVEPNVQVYADEKLLYTILRNLIGNSVKFTPEGGSIHLECQKVSGFSIITLEDNGMGIKPEQVQKFNESKGLKSTSGTAGEVGAGFGLPLALNFIKLMQADIHLDSEPNQGSKFTIQLPDKSNTLNN